MAKRKAMAKAMKREETAEKGKRDKERGEKLPKARKGKPGY